MLSVDGRKRKFLRTEKSVIYPFSWSGAGGQKHYKNASVDANPLVRFR